MNVVDDLVVVVVVLVLGWVLWVAIRTRTIVRLVITSSRWLKADLTLTPPSEVRNDDARTSRRKELPQKKDEPAGKEIGNRIIEDTD